jgi:hypothetical protein
MIISWPFPYSCARSQIVPYAKVLNAHPSRTFDAGHPHVSLYIFFVESLSGRDSVRMESAA